MPTQCGKCEEQIDVQKDKLQLCDSCRMVVHDACSSLTSSEKKVMDLKTRTMIYFCEECISVFKQAPAIIKKLDNVLKLNDDLRRSNELLVQQYTQLRSEVDKQEQYTRRNCLRVFGIAEKPGEQIEEIIISLLKNQLKLDDVTLKDIDRCHRVGAINREKNRCIIIKFTTYRMRQLAYKAKKCLKGTGIIMSEDLTRIRLGLFKKAKQNFQEAWTIDGNIFLKMQNQVVKIDTEDQLNNIIAKK